VTNKVLLESHLGIGLNGPDVETWTSQAAGSDVFSQLTEADQPLYTLDAHLGHPAVSPDTTEFLEALSGTVGDITTSDLTLTVVAKHTLKTSTRNHVRKTVNLFAGAQGYQQYFAGAETPFSLIGDGVNRDAWMGAVISDLSIPMVITTQFNTTTNRTSQFTNGVEDEVTNSPAANLFQSLSDTLAKMRIGNDSNSTDGHLFYIALDDTLLNPLDVFNNLAPIYLNPFNGGGASSFQKLFLLLNDS